MRHLPDLVLIVACSLCACHAASEGEACPAPHPTPNPDWAVTTPEAQGLSSTALQAAADYAGSHSSRCLVVIRHSMLVGEWYWQGADAQTAIPTWSVAKTYTSTLVGLALDAKQIKSVDDPASRYVPQWQGKSQGGIQLHHLLSMTSGLEFDTVADSVTLLAAQDETAQVLALQPTAPAGSLWQYSNQAVQVFEPIIRDATGKAADEYAQEKLWGPLGMKATWAKDPTGHPTMYANVLASCRDHARFGELLLRQGCWGSKRVISSSWVEQASHSSQSLNHAYGSLIWLNAGAPVLDSVTFNALPETSYHPYAPPDAFCATGLGSQMIEVIPSLDMVVVRAGYAPQDDPALATNPIAQLDAVAADGRQIVHNGVLERVLAGVLPEASDAGVSVPDAGTPEAMPDAGGPACGPLANWGAVCGGGEICDLSGQCQPAQHNAANGVVTDAVTGLAWQQELPANPCPNDGAGVCTLADAQTYCSGLSLTGYASGWRLPTANELSSLVQTTGAEPAIDTTAFPSTPPVWFWSSSPYAGSAGWVVYFFDGGSGYLDVSEAGHVRCVHS
jgi:CubicO group peptidase (beta-lactamase class C family)